MKLVEYQQVRIAKLLPVPMDRDGWRVNQRSPAVGDVGTLLDILHAPGHPDRYVVECSGRDGTTIWLDDFEADELEPVRLPSREELEGLELGLVVLVEQNDHTLRFRVSDPDVYPAYSPFDLVFGYPSNFLGEVEMENVRLRVSPCSSESEGQCVYEFVATEVVPADGQPYRVEVVAAGESRTKFATNIACTSAQVAARYLALAAAPVS